MISFNCLAPEVGEGATESHNFITCTTRMQINGDEITRKLKRKMIPPSVDRRAECSNFVTLE
jgi:hypothetical protein